MAVGSGAGRVTVARTPLSPLATRNATPSAPGASGHTHSLPTWVAEVFPAPASAASKMPLYIAARMTELPQVMSLD